MHAGHLARERRAPNMFAVSRSSCELWVGRLAQLGHRPERPARACSLAPLGLATESVGPPDVFAASRSSAGA